MLLKIVYADKEEDITVRLSGVIYSLRTTEKEIRLTDLRLYIPPEHKIGHG